MTVALDDPTRLRAVARTGLTGSAPGGAFDRVTRLAARLLDAPIALVSLVDGERQYLVSAIGTDVGETDLAHSFCKHVVIDEAPLVIAHARDDPRVREAAADGPHVIAYLGVPLTTAEGHTLGSFCVLDRSPRQWREEDLALMADLACGVVAEIELHATRRELRESQERFRGTFLGAPIGMALVAPDGQWLDVNDALVEIVGYSAQELCGMTFQDITHPEDLDADLAYVGQMLAGEIRSYEIDKRYIRKDGGLIWIRLSVSLVRGATGEPLHFVSQIEDVTRARRADEALREAQSRLRAIFDHVPAGLSLRDLDGRYLQVNSFVARALGATPEELVGHHPAEHLDPGTITRVEADDREMVRSRRPLVQEVHVPVADGTERDYHVVSYPVMDERGEVSAFGSFTLDITERRSDERSRERALEGLDEAQRIARIGSWTWDTDIDEASWSPEMYRIFARDPADGPATSEQFFAYVRAEDRDAVAAGYGETFGGGESFELDYDIVAGDGSRRTLHSLGRRDHARPGFYVGTVQDVTELRRVEREARRERDFAAAITSSMRDGLLVTRDGVIIDVNQALCELTGYPREELVGACVPYPFWAPEAIDAIQRQRALVGGRGHEFEATYARRDGTRLQVSVNTVAAEPAGGEALGYVSTIRDITEQQRHRAELERLATHDSLTGLFNHRAFHERLRAEIARAERHHHPLSVAILDLDDFKDINDLHGHPAGDRLLREAAERLRALVRKDEYLARVGGEEFAWILPEATSAGAYQAAERARDAIAATPFAGVGTITISAGVCELANASGAEQLYQLADQALYQAKRRGRNQTCCQDAAG